MHEQTAARRPACYRLCRTPLPQKSGVVAVVAGEGNPQALESLAAQVGPISIVEGRGQEPMNPSTADLRARC